MTKLLSSLLSDEVGALNLMIQGASRGIGLELVRQLLGASHVAHVFATSRNPHQSEPLAKLAKAHPERLHLLALDLTDESSILAAKQSVLDFCKELHLLFNVSGLLHDTSIDMMPEKSLRDLEPEHLLKSFKVNCIGPMLMAKHFYRLLPRRHRAIFANMSARVGSIEDNRLGGWYGYRASKAALNQFTRTLSIEISRRPTPNVICVALHPGTVDTELSEPFQANVPEEKLFTVERAARQLLEVIDRLEMRDNGKFFDWAGKPIPW